MVAMRFAKFLGYAPKAAPELLADVAAQIAVNVKFYSGDLLPYRAPIVVGNVARNGTLRAIYPMRDPADISILKWLSWLGDVDVATTTALTDEEQRIYFTGDGVPKVTNYELAVTGGPPYPVAAYELGVPLPATAPIATPVAATALATATYSRDAGNIAVITTAAPHNFKTGYYVAVSDFTATFTVTLNIAQAQITVLSDTSFSYYSSGSSGSGSDSSGRVSLAGNTVARNYIYTYVTPWGEEGVPSPVSSTVYVREGLTDGFKLSSWRF